LAEAFAQVREARERLSRQWAQENEETKLRDTLKDLGQQHFGSAEQSGPITRRVPLGRWWVAAAAAVAALAIWLAWPTASERLYKEHRHFPIASFTVKSSGEQTLADASKSFNNKDFNAALAGLNAYLQTQPDDLEARFFAGLCHLELKQFAEAEAVFRRFLSSENAWSGEARWYLALTNLRDKKEKECREILLQIPPNGAHFDEAQELLKNL
jgi:tetratricopeptide (TPR) repeat protein